MSAVVTRTVRATEEELVRRSVLPGGLRVVTEAMPGVRSVAVGVWVRVGSRDESPALAGASHFLEHMLFKGTRRRNAQEIANVLDRLGGDSNAYTTKEYTCFYARVLAEDLAVTVDVLADMVTDSLLGAGDLDNERDVVLDELAMHDDDPGDRVHDVFAEALFAGHPLGRPILGTPASVHAMSRRALHGYYRRRYQVGEMVVAAAGRLEHAHVVRQVRRAFAQRLDAAGAVGPVSGGATPVRGAARAGWTPSGPRVALVDRPTEQVNLVLGTPGIARTDPRRFALGVLANALGGGSSSRLFQEVRERRGLAYSVYSFTSHFSETGMFGVYAGCQPARARDVLELCRAVLDDVAERGITPEELDRGRRALRASLVLGLEDTGARMTRAGKGELLYGELLGTDDLLARISAVTCEEVAALARTVLAGPMTLAAIGPLADRELADLAG